MMTGHAGGRRVTYAGLDIHKIGRFVVGLAAVGDLHHEHGERVVVDLVEHAPVPCGLDAPGALAAGEFDASGRVWLVGEPVVACIRRRIGGSSLPRAVSAGRSMAMR
jgi:hypothetical protein